MTYVPLGFNPQPEPPGGLRAQRFMMPSFYGMGEISTVDISHFRAPYKNAYPYTGIGTVDLPMVLGLGIITVASIALLVHIGRK
jgi:hypothetical protein